jgi:aldehyde dehydrogenase (NAD+)
MVETARSEGALVLAGGHHAELEEFPRGLFYEPTILSGLPNDNIVAQEEIFGPVLVVIPFSGEDDAVAVANGTSYGLAAGVWTRDIKRAHRVARRLQAGTVWINTYRAMTYNSPFGGYRNSGVGRSNGMQAIRDYLQTKSIWCELSDEIQDPFVLRM